MHFIQKSTCLIHRFDIKKEFLLGECYKNIKKMLLSKVTCGTIMKFTGGDYSCYATNISTE